jgi:hypothetical protein
MSIFLLSCAKLYLFCCFLQLALLALTSLSNQFESFSPSSSSCLASNSFISSWSIDQPSPLSLVSSTFPFSMKVIVYDVSSFQQRNSEFSLCIRVKQLSLSKENKEKVFAALESLSSDTAAQLDGEEEVPGGFGGNERKSKDHYSVQKTILRRNSTSSRIEKKEIEETGVILLHECDLQVFDNHPLFGQSGLLEMTVGLYQRIDPSSVSDGKEKELVCEAKQLIFCCQEDFPELQQQNLQNRTISKIIDGFIEEAVKILHHPSGTTTSIPSVSSSSTLSCLPSFSSSASSPSSSQIKPRILLGIKSFALNIHLRDAIRSSYLSQTAALSSLATISTFFLIGYSPFISKDPRILSLLAEEKLLYSDNSTLLLEEELPIQDNYYVLTEKVMNFLFWSYSKREERKKKEGEIEKEKRTKGKESTSFSFSSYLEADYDYVIITDDDTYLDIPSLVRLLTEEKEKQLLLRNSEYSFYAGEVSDTYVSCSFS